MSDTPSRTKASSGSDGLSWAQFRVAVRNEVAEALSTVSAACDQPADTVFLTAAALTLYRYGRKESVSVLALSRDEEPGEDRIVEVSLALLPETLVRQSVSQVADQWRVARPFVGPKDGVGTGSLEVFRADLHRCLVTPTIREELIAGGGPCISFALCTALAKAALLVLYRPDRLGRRLARQLARHVLKTLVEMARQMDRPIAHCGLLTPAERRQILARSRGPSRDYPLRGGLQALFERRAGSAPDAVAVIDEESPGAARSAGYGELNRFANGLAHAIRQAGARRGSRVAVVLRRSIESVGALLATIKAGAVFVPLDDSYPAEYIRRILEETAPAAVLAAPQDAERLAALFPDSAVVPVEWPGPRAEDPGNPRIAAGAEETFLILYTSGSTGRPKGVVHRQRQVLNRLYWMWETYPFSASEVMCQRSPLTVMPAVWELLGGLLKGVPTVIASREVARDPRCMAELVARHAVTRMTLLPSLLLRLLERKDAPRSLASLRTVIVGGEMSTADLYRTFHRKLPQCVLIEDYGCTEVNTIWHSPLDPRDPGAETLPGGQPIANLGVYVLDRFGHLAPPGLVGEIAVAGGSLATGYIGSPEAYEERFVANHIDPSMGPRLYRTGDLGYHEFSGSFKLTGRAGHQLKIRGIRVEPSEIEGALALHDAVDECCAVSRPDPQDGEELVVFVVPRPGARIRAAELRACLSDRLPPFMIPNRIITAERLPKTPSGKLDRRALAARAAMVDPVPGAAGSGLLHHVRTLLAQVLGQQVSEAEDHLELRLLGLDSARTVILAQRLSDSLGLEVSATALFDHASVAALGAHLSERLAPPPEAGPESFRRPDAPVPRGRGARIAVIGMAGRLPEADTLDQLWSNLAAGREAVREIPEDRWPIAGFYGAEAGPPDRSISKWGCFLSRIREFDPLFFGISPADAAFMDPQHRIGLEEAWKAFEDAGYPPDALDGGPVGVFVGLRRGDFESLLDRSAAPPNRATLLGNDPSMLASRLAFRMNLQGPGLTVDTACSSSLAAVHLACQSLLAGECDMALAGGVCLVLSPDFYVATSRLGIFSPTGKCRAFDREADGFVQGEGAGFVVLKRLDDALRDGDNVHAVIQGTALNQDGRTNGIGAPSPRAQAEVEERVYRQFGIDPRTITYVEAHGTGTQLGDPIEIEALTRSFRAYGAERGFCAIGSIKTNIGHLTAAAGIAGLIKAILCLAHRQIPPSLNFERQNPLIRFEDTPFYVNDRLRPWEAAPGSPRRAAVNSFGLSGTNVHCVVEEAPSRPEPDPDTAPGHLVLLTAHTPGSLARRIAELRSWVRRHGQDHRLRDVAFTLLAGRERHSHGRAFVASDFAELERLLAEAENGSREVSEIAGRELGEAVLARLESGGLEPEEYRRTLETLGDLAARGLTFDVRRLYPPGAARRLSLPTAPFERQTCWPPPERLRSAGPVEPEEPRQPAESPPPTGDDLLGLLRGVLGTLLALEPSTLDPEVDLDSYGYDSIVAVDLKATLEEALGREVPIDLLAGGMSLQGLAGRLREGDAPLAPFPLTGVQAAYFFGKVAAADGVGCHTYFEIEVENLDLPRLTRAWNRLIRHHPMLRTRIRRNGDQQVLGEVPFYDIEACAAEDDAALERHRTDLRSRMSHRLYEPGDWPLFEIRATLGPGRKAVLHVSMDNWIVDWVSAEMLYESWYRLYHAPETALAPLDFTFRDYCSHLNALRASESGRRQLEYWRRKLSDAPEGPALPYLEPVPGAPARFRRHHATIEAGLWSALEKRAAAIAVFPTSLVLAAFLQTLAEASGEERFSIVLTHAHRRRFHPRAGKVVGPFTSTSVCIADRVQGASLDDFAVRLNGQISDDLLNRDVCASHALAALAREKGRIPSLPVVFTARLGGGPGPEERRPSWLDHVSFAVSQTPGVALENRVREVDGRLEIAWDVAETKLAADCVETLLGDFRRRLEQAAGEPGDLPLTALQQVYLAERMRADQGLWAEATVYQELEVQELDVERFARALRRLSELEPAIGGTITERGCLRPLERRRTPRIEVEDLRLAGRDASASRLEQIRRSMLASRAPEDWAPSLRARISRIERGATRVHLATDMALADGFSVLLLYVRLFELCRNPGRALAAEGASFVDHLARRRRERASPEFEEDLAYWIRKVEEAPAGPALPRPEAHREDRLPVARLAAELEHEAALRARAAERGLRLESVLVAAFNRVLSSRARRRPFKTVVALAGRDAVAADAPSALGDFTALSWVTESLEPRPFSRHAAEVAATLARDLEHRKSSPIEALRRLGRGADRDGGSHRVAFTACLTGRPVGWPAGVAWGYGVSLTPGVDLDSYVHNLGGRLSLHWDYRPAALDEGAAADLFACYQRFLECLAATEEAWEDSWTLESGPLREHPAGSRQEGRP